MLRRSQWARSSLASCALRAALPLAARSPRAGLGAAGPVARAGIHQDTRHKFVDKARLEVIGGSGGSGIISFESIDNVRKRPIGGHGGRGGDVIVEASQSVRDLNFQTYVVRGRDGGPATGKGNNGKAGKGKKIMVPVGTVLKEIQRSYAFGEEDNYAYVPSDLGKGAGEEDDAYEEEEAEGFEAQGGEGSEPDTEEARGGRRRSNRSRRGSRGAALGDAEEQPEERGQQEEVDEDEGLSEYRLGGEGEEEEEASSSAAQRPARAARFATSAEELAADPTVLSVKERTSRSGVPFREIVRLLADLDTHGQALIVARGGAAGTGNKGSLLTYRETMERVTKAHVSGAAGEVRHLELELKSIADVGLVGFPNAGKSSFLGAVSKAKPRVADYPFTTLHPTVGVIPFPDEFRMTIADIPGLIEGAHQDRGLGHEFLRHIERTRVLAYVLDMSGGGGADPLTDLRTLQNELRLYDPALPRRPSLIIANKVDQEGGKERAAKLRAATSLPVVEASALRGHNLGLVINSLRWLIEAANKA